jgi:hypothetical protein
MTASAEGEMQRAAGEGGAAPAPRRERAALGALLALFAALAAWHAWRLPIFEGADEPGNLRYLQFLLEEGRLAQPSIEVTPELEGLDRGIVPPLWFLLHAPVAGLVRAQDFDLTGIPNPAFLRQAAAADPRTGPDTRRLRLLHGREEAVGSPGQRAVRVLRLAQIPWALLTLLGTYAAARLLVGGRRWPVAFGAASLLAATPQFHHLAGTLTMDLALAAFGALALAASVAWVIAADRRQAVFWALLAGGAAGLAAATKLNGLVLVPAIALAGTIAALRGRGFWKPAAASAAACALLGAPWYLWGWWETGHPLWAWHYQNISPYHVGQQAMAVPQSLARWVIFTQSLFGTWFGALGWTALWLPLWLMLPLSIAAMAGAAGALALLLEGAGRARAGAMLLFVGALGGAAGIVAATPWRGLWSLAPDQAWGAVVAVALAAGVLLFALARRVLPELRGGRVEQPPQERVPSAAGTAGLATLVGAAALILGAEVYFNLHFLQAQARHLYPFLPALVVPAALGLSRLGLLPAAVLAHLVAAIATLPLIEQHFRPPGWNAHPLHAVTDSNAPVRPDAPQRSDGPRWLAPEDGAALPGASAPTLVLAGDPDAVYDFVVGVGTQGLRSRMWRAESHVVRTAALLGGPFPGPRAELVLPATFWAGLPPGRQVEVQAIALDADGRAVDHSPVLRFEKAP